MLEARMDSTILRSDPPFNVFPSFVPYLNSVVPILIRKLVSIVSTGSPLLRGIAESDQNRKASLLCNGRGWGLSDRVERERPPWNCFWVAAQCDRGVARGVVGQFFMARYQGQPHLLGYHSAAPRGRHLVGTSLRRTQRKNPKFQIPISKTRKQKPKGRTRSSWCLPWPPEPSPFQCFIGMKANALSISSIMVAAGAAGYAAWVHSRGESAQTVFGLLLVVIGAVEICGAGCDWDWFMANRTGRLLIAICSRPGARVVYGFIGILLVLLGLWIQLQWPHRCLPSVNGGEEM